VIQSHAFGAEFKPGTLVLPVDEPQHLQEDPPEIVHTVVALPELHLQRIP